MKIIKFFKKSKIKSLAQSERDNPFKIDQKIIKFENAEHTIFEKEALLIQKLVNVLSNQSVDRYDQTICDCIKSINNQPLSLRRLIMIIIRNSTINSPTEHILQCLPYESREKIIDQISKTWPSHRSLIQRLKHISYLVHFFERGFPEKSFLCLMPKDVIAEFILEGKTSNLSGEG